MRFLGFKFSFKRESKWVSREEFEGLSGLVLALSEDTKSALNGVEAGRKRLERHIGKGNGEVVVQESGPSQETNLASLGPGDCPTQEQLLKLMRG